MKAELTNLQIGAIGGIIIISSFIVLFILNDQKKQIQNSRLIIESVKKMVILLTQFEAAFYKPREFMTMVNHEEKPFQKDHLYKYTNYAKKYNSPYFIEEEGNNNE